MVDPSSGYRFYQPGQVVQARMVAHLRRVGLPLADIRTVVTEPGLAGPVLAAHLDRLDAGLADARREISLVHHLLETTETPMHRCTLSATALVSALRDVRYAVSHDPEEPRLNGVYLDSEPGLVRVVATDRYRLATSTVVTTAETDLHLLLATSAVDELLAGDPTGAVEVRVSDGTITLTGDGVTVEAPVPEVDFPAYRMLLDQRRREVLVDAASLRRDLETLGTAPLAEDALVATDDDVSVLSISDDAVRVGASDDPGALVVAVNRRFLLEALQVGGQLTLGLDDPIAPLAIRHRDRGETLSIVMPVRLDQPA